MLIGCSTIQTNHYIKKILKPAAKNVSALQILVFCQNEGGYIVNNATAKRTVSTLIKLELAGKSSRVENLKNTDILNTKRKLLKKGN